MKNNAFDKDAALREIREKCAVNFEYYAETCLKIRPKNGQIEPFILNKAQKYIIARIKEQKKQKGYVRAIILKGRQQGCSTLIQGRLRWLVTHNFGVRAFILTHEEEATKNLFEMTKRYHDNCPPLMQPKIKASNSTELIFSELDSSYRLGTAGNKSVGRSQTVQYLHASEAAFYQHADEHAKGIMQTVPLSEGTEVYIESTANGVGNWFHQQWQEAEAGTSQYIAIFVPWYWQDEYAAIIPDGFILDEKEKELKDIYLLSDAQLAWRRIKIKELSVNGIDGVKAFQQEYPCCPAEAFNNAVDTIYIQSDLVATARKTTVEKVGPLVIGLDIARFGDDRTAIIRRRGRVAYNLEIHQKKDLMHITGIIVNIINTEQPVKVFIDICGLGAGVYDRLKELGYGDIIVGVNSAEQALDQDRYTNKRAELWAEGKKWLEDKPVQIPDSNELHADLSSCTYSVDSKGRLKIESKADQKKRGIRSSDTADSLLLTFALPIAAYNSNSHLEKKKVAAEFARKTHIRNRRVSGFGVI